MTFRIYLIFIFSLSQAFFVLVRNAHAQTDREVWRAVEDSSLVIKSGSALDFTKMLGVGTAGSKGRLIVDTGGALRFETDIDPARFNCASLAWSPATGGFPAGEQADLFARQLRMHGYNIVRFHYVEASLMSGRSDDFDFDPEQLRRWLYFLSALKREGIYWVMDAMTSDNGAVGGVFPHRWVKKHDLKLRVQFDPSAKEHWQQMVSRLLGINNPYTGLRVIDDPALVGVVLVNEGGLNYLALHKQEWPAALAPAFNRWLAKRYKDSIELARAWGDLGGEESLEMGSIQMPKKLRDRSARMTDWQRFLVDSESETARWMTKYLRELGFKGLVTSHNNWVSSQADAVRAGFEWVDMHAYHDESYSFGRGATIKQTSSLDDGARYARWLAAARQVGKPFSVTEYGQPFWNRYRFEAGLVIPALARLQGWGFSCLHAEGAIDLSMRLTVPRKKAIHPYGVGIDPVARAGETLASLLTLRGDVTPAKHAVRLDFSGDRPYRDSGVGVVGDDMSYLAWLTRIESDSGQYPKKQAANEVFRVTTDGVSVSISGKLIERLTGGTDARLSSYVDRLRQQGVLSPDNRTDVKRGIFQSATGEIVLDREQGLFSVVTQRTEAAAMREAAKRVELGVLSIESTSTAALLAASALDEAPLATSRSILLIFATDAENTDMQFADQDRKQLLDLGRMPVRIRKGIADVFMKGLGKSNFSLYSLHLNGDRGDRIPVIKERGGIRFSLNNVAPLHGPTTFFLLEAP